MKYLEQAIAAHQSGNAVLAEELYQSQLKETPKEHNALQLLGMLKMATQRLEEGAKLMQESLQIEPQQPHVWNNLGACFKRMSRFNEAKESFESAVLHKPDFMSAHKNLVNLAMQQQDLKETWRAANNAMLKIPNDADVLRLYGKAANFVGKFDIAIETFEKLLSKQGENVGVLHDLGIASRMQGDLEKALACFEKVKLTKPDNFSVHHNLGNTLSDMGKIEDAIESYRMALKLNPDYVETHKNLNHLLWEVGDNDAFLSSFHPIFDSGQITAALLLSYIELLVFAKSYELALETIEPYKQMLESHPEYYGFKASCEFALGDYDEALDTLKFGVGLTQHLGLRKEYGRQLVEAGHLGEAESQLVQLLESSPNDQLGLALLAHCRAQTKPDWTAQLNDYQGMVKEYDLLEKIKDKVGGEFLEEVKVLLVQKHSASRAPLNQTLVEGTQTKGNLFKSDIPIIQALKEVMVECLRDYNETAVSKPRNYFGEREVNDFEFAGAWSVKLDRNGHHNSHIHPEGWLSSVLYLDVTVGNDSSKDGWFYLGGMPSQRGDATQPVKYIKPEVGKLILFPSYMWHGTVPNTLSDRRLTVAFDVREKELVI